MIGQTPLHPTFDKLFAFGIDPEPGKAPADQPRDWPSETEVRDYVARVRENLGTASIDPQLMNVAIEHRLMHAETLAYLIHNLPYDSKRGPSPVSQSRAPVENGLVDVPAGVAWLGRERGNGFGWDNEFDRHAVDVPGVSHFAVQDH